METLQGYYLRCDKFGTKRCGTFLCFHGSAALTCILAVTVGGDGRTGVATCIAASAKMKGHLIFDANGKDESLKPFGDVFFQYFLTTCYSLDRIRQVTVKTLLAGGDKENLRGRTR